MKANLEEDNHQEHHLEEDNRLELRLIIMRKYNNREIANKHT